MAKAVGANEMQRERIIVALRSGASFKDATDPYRKDIEADWFERNEKHLLEVARGKPLAADVKK